MALAMFPPEARCSGVVAYKYEQEIYSGGDDEGKGNKAHPMNGDQSDDTFNDAPTPEYAAAVQHCSRTTNVPDALESSTTPGRRPARIGGGSYFWNASTLVTTRNHNTEDNYRGGKQHFDYMRTYETDHKYCNTINEENAEFTDAEKVAAYREARIEKDNCYNKLDSIDSTILAYLNTGCVHQDLVTILEADTEGTNDLELLNRMTYPHLMGEIINGISATSGRCLLAYYDSDEDPDNTISSTIHYHLDPLSSAAKGTDEKGSDHAWQGRWGSNVSDPASKGNALLNAFYPWITMFCYRAHEVVEDRIDEEDGVVDKQLSIRDLLDVYAQAKKSGNADEYFPYDGQDETEADNASFDQVDVGDVGKPYKDGGSIEIGSPCSVLYWGQDAGNKDRSGWETLGVAFVAAWFSGYLDDFIDINAYYGNPEISKNIFDESEKVAVTATAGEFTEQDDCNPESQVYAGTFSGCWSVGLPHINRAMDFRLFQLQAGGSAASLAPGQFTIKFDDRFEVTDDGNDNGKRLSENLLGSSFETGSTHFPIANYSATDSHFQIFEPGINEHHQIRLNNFWALCDIKDAPPAFTVLSEDNPEIVTFPKPKVGEREPDSPITRTIERNADGSVSAYTPSGLTDEGYSSEGGDKPRDITNEFWEVADPFKQWVPRESTTARDNNRVQLNNSQNLETLFQAPQGHLCAIVWSGYAGGGGQLYSARDHCDFNVLWGLDFVLESVCDSSGYGTVIRFFGGSERDFVFGDVTDVQPYGGGLFELQREHVSYIGLNAVQGSPRENIIESQEAITSATDWFQNNETAEANSWRTLFVAFIGMLSAIGYAVFIGSLAFLMLGTEIVLLFILGLMPLILLAGMFPHPATQERLWKLLTYLAWAFLAKFMVIISLAVMLLIVATLGNITRNIGAGVGYSEVFNLLITPITGLALFIVGKRFFKLQKRRVSSIAAETQISQAGAPAKGLVGQARGYGRAQMRRAKGSVRRMIRDRRKG